MLNILGSNEMSVLFILEVIITFIKVHITIIISITGAIFSIVGARVALIQAKRASKYAQQAEEQIKSRRIISVTSRLIEIWERLNKELIIFSEAANENSIRRKNNQLVASEAKEYIEKVRLEQDNLNINDFNEHYNNINGCIEKFAEATSFPDIKKSGTDLFRGISGINFLIQKLHNTTTATVELV